MLHAAIRSTCDLLLNALLSHRDTYITQLMPPCIWKTPWKAVSAFIAGQPLPGYLWCPTRPIRRVLWFWETQRLLRVQLKAAAPPPPTADISVDFPCHFGMCIKMFVTEGQTSTAGTSESSRFFHKPCACSPVTIEIEDAACFSHCLPHTEAYVQTVKTFLTLSHIVLAGRSHSFFYCTFPACPTALALIWLLLPSHP